MPQSFFSKSYNEARRSFRSAVAHAGGGLQTFPIFVEGVPELTIDVASLGPQDAEAAIVISSGCHGVEGYFGSAVQCAWLEQHLTKRPQLTSRVVLIHAINPYGFAKLRRFNEDNVDLNRNFLSLPQEYAGFPNGYDQLDGFLNPPAPPSPYEPFRLKAMWNIWRWGLPVIKAAIAGGQYTFPRGLFYGGTGPSQSTRVIQEHFKGWIGPAQRIVHIDLHTGLGAFGTYKLLLEAIKGSKAEEWYHRAFEKQSVQPLSNANGIAYPSKGVAGKWLESNLSGRDYRFAVAEFGTFDIIRVLAAIRSENQAHWYCPSGSRQQQKCKAELLECFVPTDATWRRTVVAAGLDIIWRSIEKV